jgi:hypothetical protein
MKKWRWQMKLGVVNQTEMDKRWDQVWSGMEGENRKDMWVNISFSGLGDIRTRFTPVDIAVRDSVSRACPFS